MTHPKTLSKFTFDNSKTNFYPSGNDMLNFVRPDAKKLSIQLLEIASVDTPSDFIIKFRNHKGYFYSALYKYRTKFLFQNGIFILDTTELPEFNFDIEYAEFEIDIAVHPDKFKMTMYYTTDVIETKLTSQQ